MVIWRRVLDCLDCPAFASQVTHLINGWLLSQFYNENHSDERNGKAKLSNWGVIKMTWCHPKMGWKYKWMPQFEAWPLHLLFVEATSCYSCGHLVGPYWVGHTRTWDPINLKTLNGCKFLLYAFVNADKHCNALTLCRRGQGDWIPLSDLKILFKCTATVNLVVLHISWWCLVHTDWNNLAADVVYKSGTLSDTTLLLRVTKTDQLCGYWSPNQKVKQMNLDICVQKMRTPEYQHTSIPSHWLVGHYGR